LADEWIVIASNVESCDSS